MKIAFLGSRGIPRCYSGFETFVEELSTRLVRLGNEVTVYNRTPFNKFAGDEFHGVRIVRIPTLPAKGTDTLVHSALCTAHTLASRYDIVYYCGVGSAIFSGPAKLRGAKTLVNVDGADWERAKWGPLGKSWLRWSEGVAARFADCVIADHPIIRDRYRRQFGIECALLSYGADVVESDPGTAALREFRLKEQGYFLYISRLTPENKADLVMEAHLASNVDVPLVVVGDAPYVSAYLERLKGLAAASSGRIVMTGYQFGPTYRQLSFHARAFIFPTTIEATRPVLLEQMGMGTTILARDTPANRYILADSAMWFSDGDPLKSLIAAIKAISDPGYQPGELGAAAQARIRTAYNWDTIATEYDTLFRRLAKFDLSDRSS